MSHDASRIRNLIDRLKAIQEETDTDAIKEAIGVLNDILDTGCEKGQ